MSTVVEEPLSSGWTNPRVVLGECVCLSCIGKHEFAVRHTLAEHPLLSLNALADLADRLPIAAVERHNGKQPLVHAGEPPNLKGLPSETVRTIDSNGRWMVLWNIEQVRAYRELLDEILTGVEEVLPASERGMGRREAFIFLSAPGAITPAHFDPENNFLLQIRGTKTLHVGCFANAQERLRELDRYHDGDHRNLVSLPPRSSTFELHPGDGAYLYPWAPHWVVNGPKASVSLSITFRTGRSEEEEYVHLLNAHLRRRGLSPTPAGRSRIVDYAKGHAAMLAAWAKRGLRPLSGPRDFTHA